jgi:signal transduction histidine kinase
MFLVLLIALIPGIVLQILLHLQVFRSEQERELQTHTDVARAVATAFRTSVEEKAQSAYALGLAVVQLAPKDIDEAVGFLSAARLHYPATEELAWLTPKGVVVASSRPEAIGEDRHSEEYVSELAKGGIHWMLGPVQPDSETGAPTFIIAHPVKGDDGSLLGILTMAIDAERFADARLKIQRTPDSGYILFDNKGIAVFRRPYFPFPDWRHRDFSQEVFVSAALSGREARGKLHIPMTGKTWFTARTPVPGLGWAAGAGREYDTAMAPIFRDLRMGVALSLLCLLISGSIAFCYSRGIMEDLRGLHDSVSAWGKSHAIHALSNVQHVTELKNIAAAFDVMAKKREETEQALRKSEWKYRIVADNTYDYEFWRDPQGNFAYISPSCERISGYTPGEFIANPELARQVAHRTELAESRARKLQILVSKLTTAEHRERRRLAEILHDHLQQLLLAAKMHVEVLSSGLNKNRRRSAEVVIDLLLQSVKVSRSLTAELSPPILKQGRLSDSLCWLARWMKENHGLEVELRVEAGINPEREDLKILFFESIRELLFNTVKHSGAKAATVAVSCDSENNFHVSVADAGGGFDPAAVNKITTRSGFGLLGIRERIDLLGGNLEIESSPGNGARFSFSVPGNIIKEQ